MSTTTKERPILFSGGMVRRILCGRKTQTRRVMKPQPEFSKDGVCWYPTVPLDICGRKTNALAYGNEHHFRKGAPIDFSPYGQPGDRLWVRETWAEFPSDKDWIYRADQDEQLAHKLTWRPSIFMPRAACRLTLEVTEIRAQRLQDMSPGDMCAEGVTSEPLPEGHKDEPTVLRWNFSDLWNEINGARGFGWDSNPWVWAITFRRAD